MINFPEPKSELEWKQMYVFLAQGSDTLVEMDQSVEEEEPIIQNCAKSVSAMLAEHLKIGLDILKKSPFAANQNDT